MKTIVAVFAIAGAVYGDVIKDQWLDLAWHNFLDRQIPPWAANSKQGDVIKDQWLDLAWHNYLDKLTPPWTAAPLPRPPTPPMHPKQGTE
ncbi:hypothetical protein TELCIR_02783 [Teladorsagia circumcincta]|uniref:Uncharacterized protein n=1 Tax=Teladorsagia circumcincta TaxID=45464 RepID=A0A2G9UY69_TELCI|nr:hypothetical protein TELCIR_02783 [Teladorsagia circumcincta]